jgi:hypothetical protein
MAGEAYRRVWGWLADQSFSLMPAKSRPYFGIVVYRKNLEQVPFISESCENAPVAVGMEERHAVKKARPGNL